MIDFFMSSGLLGCDRILVGFSTANRPFSEYKTFAFSWIKCEILRVAERFPFLATATALGIVGIHRLLCQLTGWEHCFKNMSGIPYLWMPLTGQDRNGSVSVFWFFESQFPPAVVGDSNYFTSRLNRRCTEKCNGSWWWSGRLVWQWQWCFFWRLQIEVLLRKLQIYGFVRPLTSWGLWISADDRCQNLSCKKLSNEISSMISKNVNQSLTVLLLR